MGQSGVEVQKQEPESVSYKGGIQVCCMIQQANWLLSDPYLTPRLENRQPFNNN